MVALVEWALLFFVLFVALSAAGLWVYRFARGRKEAPSHAVKKDSPPIGPAALGEPVQQDYQVSYAPPEFEWSGNSSGSLTVKILTYKQYECLEDARYGFTIVGLPPSERDLPLPHKTRAHGLKTVASLSKHGFLSGSAESGYAITDLGLHALAVCSVRY